MPVIVTGGAGGIGSAVVNALVGRGERVASLDLRPSSGATLSIECDLADEASAEEGLSQAIEGVGPPDKLVCATGLVVEAPIAELSLVDWRLVLDSSLTSVFLACRRVIPHLVESGAGRVLLFSSGYATKGYARGAPYAAAKAGVEAFAKSLALEVATARTTVNVISPGPIETPMLGHVHAQPGRHELTRSMIPQGRIGEPSDLLGAVLFLLGPESAYITGQVLQVNGGMLMP